jgi:hypothetical protein
MLREDPQIHVDKPDWRRTAARRTRGILCAVVLCAGMALGTPALGQTTDNPAADREMADRYDRAARAGDDIAQFYLGSLYAQGVGRPQSDTDAFAWVEQAAKRGNAQAMLVAAGMTALGKGTPKDYVVSYKWAFLVAEGAQAVDLKNGARQLMTLLQQRLTPEQILSAKTQAYQFRAILTPSAAAVPAATSPAATAPAPAAAPPTVAAPAPAAPALQPASPTGGPQQTAQTPPAQTDVALEAQKHLNKENVDKLMKNVPPQYRKRFGF